MKAILTYHSVDEGGSPISIHPDTFVRHCERLALLGPRVVSLDELLRLPAGESAVAITFDDAYTNFATQAWPVLRAYRMPVTLFVPTACVGGTNAWDASLPWVPRLEILDWDALGRLVDEGVTLGSHTRTHAYLPGVSAAQLADELEGSAADLERLTGTRPRGLAYPYGALNNRVELACGTSYQYACTTELRPLDGGERPHQLPRVDMYYLRAAYGLEFCDTLAFRVYLNARAGARRWRALLAVGGAV